MLLKNEVIMIRKFDQNDIPELFRLLSDDIVMEYIEDVFSYEQAEKFAYEYGITDTPAIYAVGLKNQIFIGYIIFKPYDNSGAYEIGWLLKEEYWGKGYASMITKMLIDYSKKEEIKSLVIEFDKRQKASKAIAIKFGFEFIRFDKNLMVYSKSL